MRRWTLRAAWRRTATAWVLMAASSWASAQPDAAASALQGTLAKVRESGAITIGYRESSIPFSYLSSRGEPIGYTIDLCKLLVEAISDEVGRAVAIRWQPVSAETRLQAVTSGQVDLECGSTTINLERQRLVSFSPTIFVAGTRLLVRKGSPIQSWRDLGGKRVIVTSGTTNERTLRDLIARFKIDTRLVIGADHAASYGQLAAGQVDAFATDDVLLYGLLAQYHAQSEYQVVGELLSYDPYGVMYRRDDPQLASLVDAAIHQLAREGEIERRYRRWFLRPLPTSGVSLDLPMGPQLETLIQTMVAPSD